MHQVSRRRFLATSGSIAGASLFANGEVVGQSRHQPPFASGDEIRLAFTEYQRYTPLATGEVGMSNPTLNWVRGPRGEMLRRAASDPEMHGGEGSMLGHLLRIASGDDSLAAIPVFLLRNFTARDLYVLNGSSLTPDTLNGHRVGIYNWAASGAVWYRHFVRYLGQDPYEIRWVVGGTDTPRSVRHRVPLPSHVRNAPEDRSLSDLLIAGEIDAYFAPIPPRRYDRKEGPIVRLIPGYRAVEEQYYRETGCYPPQHVLLLRKAVLQERPSVGHALLQTFQECEQAFMTAQQRYPYATPWMIEDIEDTIRLMGSDFHHHGLERNRRALENFLQSAYDDRMTERRVTVDEYFHEFLAI